MKTLVGLDLDGTLEDSRADMVASVQRCRQRLGLAQQPDDAFRGLVNGGMERLYRTCFEDHLGDDPSVEQLADVQALYEADYLEHIADRTELYDGIREMLEALSPHAKLVCVTNKPERHASALLDALGVRNYFSGVVGGDTCTHAKPHPVMMERARELAQVSADTPAVMVGDTAGDVKLGKAAGARTVWCAWGYTDKIDEAPDFQVTHPSDLVPIALQD